MISLNGEQIYFINCQAFLGRLQVFLANRGKSATLRRLASDRAMALTFWTGYCTGLKGVTEHDAAVFLTFMLACKAEGVDLERALATVSSLSSEDAELGMKRFLEDRGHLRFSDFDFSDEATPDPVS
jgi:hypothetical protein